MKPIKYLMLLGIVGILSGCPLDVIVTSGGDVISDSATRDCAGGNTCQFDVVDTTFSETFTAVPKPGYEFTKWQAGPEFFCDDSTDPTCTISTLEFQGNPGVESIIASDAVGKIKPIFHVVQRLSTGYIIGALGQPHSNFSRQGNWTSSIVNGPAGRVTRITIPGFRPDCGAGLLPNPVLTSVYYRSDLDVVAKIAGIGPCGVAEDWYFDVNVTVNGAPSIDRDFTFSFIDPLYPD